MNFFKNKKLMIILSCIVVACIALCTVLYFANTKTNEEKSEAEVPSVSDVKDDKVQTEEATKEDVTETKENKPDITEGNGPVNIQNGDDLVGKIDKFNSLNDGDPEKEKIRKELEDLFAYAEGTTLN